jgi:hypothetical protein
MKYPGLGTFFSWPEVHVRNSRQRPNKRLQLALQAFVQRPLFRDKVISLQSDKSRFGLCSLDPCAPAGRS